MADRLKSLRRIGAVQDQMVRMAEWRLAEAERTCHDLKSTKSRLQGYIMEESALGPSLAKAALKSIQSVETRLRQAESLRDESRKQLEGAKRRDKALANLTEGVARQAARAEEDRTLAETIEVWLAARGASLP